ncbi:MAG: 4Fe-4S binding protein, partial [Oscillospiraceae bacterium]
EFVAEVAFVRCSGDCHATTSKYKFEGTQSCAAANRFYSGSEFCTYGCLGFGDCAEICPNEAISVLDNVASVDKTKCVACGLCVKTCPNSLIEIHKISSHVSVACSSTELGKVVKKICTAGCIGCKICEKKCPNNAIHVENNLAKIDYALCTNCGECVSACPVKVIKSCEK